MNYRDYMEIMESEGLTLPKVFDYLLDKAKECQRIIRVLQSHTDLDTTKQQKQMEEEKIKWILEAIESARFAKEYPDIHMWADRQLEQQLKRR